jgi:hypothetical protein
MSCHNYGNVNNFHYIAFCYSNRSMKAFAKKNVLDAWNVYPVQRIRSLEMTEGG